MNESIILGSIFLSSLVPLTNDYYLIPSGENIVFDLKIDGLLITGAYDIQIDNSIYNPFKDNDLRVGDLIVGVNNKRISSLEDFTFTISYDKVNDIKLKIKRKNDYLDKKIKLFYINNSIKTGLYVKNDVYGIGTISYIDPLTNRFGSLGHEVVDDVSKDIVLSTNGSIYFENVLRINKGRDYCPGNKECEITLQNQIGIVELSNKNGVFGTYIKEVDDSKKIKVAKQNEIHEGKAFIKTCISGSKIENFEIRITSVNRNDLDKEKGMMFEIVDKKLLNVSGGVYSGMSGSPIIQDNKFVGVVTHVINSTICKGYALYIDTMFKASAK